MYCSRPLRHLSGRRQRWTIRAGAWLLLLLPLPFVVPPLVHAQEHQAGLHILDAPVGENEAVLYRSTARLTPVYRGGNTHDSREYARASWNLVRRERTRLYALDELLLGHLESAISASTATLPVPSVGRIRIGDSIEVGEEESELMRVVAIDSLSTTVTVAERRAARGGRYAGPREWPEGTPVFLHRRAMPEPLPGYMVDSGIRPQFDNFRLSWVGRDVPYLAINMDFPGGDDELKDWMNLLVYVRLSRSDGQGRSIEGILPLAADAELPSDIGGPGDPYTIREQHLRLHLDMPNSLDSRPEGARIVSHASDVMRAIVLGNYRTRTFLQEMLDWIYAEDGHDLGRIYSADDRYSADEFEALAGSPDTASESLVRSYQIDVDVAFLDGTDPRIDAGSFSILNQPEGAESPEAGSSGAGAPAVEAALTAELHGVPDSHDGSEPFSFRILFSEPVTVGYAALKSHAFEVTDATILKAQRVDGRDDLRKFTVQPSADAAAVLILPVTDDCAGEGAICTSEGKHLSTRLLIVVPPGGSATPVDIVPTALSPGWWKGSDSPNLIAPTELTAQFLDVPSSHDGQTAFTFELRFSEEFPVSYLTLRDHAFTVVGGSVQKARRLERDSDTPNVRWEITVTPDGDGDLTILLPQTTDCDAEGAICTTDGRMLSSRLEATARGRN